MITCKYVLSGAASLALGGLIAAPGFARDDYSRFSTPVERAQTEDLNRNGVTVVSPTPAEQERYDAARAQYEEAQTIYNRQLEEYNAKTRAYDAQRRNYREGVEASQDRAEAYEDARTQYENEVAPPPPVVARFDRLWTLDRVVDPNSELYNLPVEDIDGFMSGHFRRVEIRASGERMAVITLNSLHTISIPAEDVRFDPDRGVVVAEWTSRDLERVPPG